MANSSFSYRSNMATMLVAFALLLVAPLASQAQVHDIQTVRDDTGWRLQVDGEDFFIKGVVWGYSPRGQNYSYNLWGQGDDYIRKVLDYDFGMMSAAGVNAIRSFAMIPPRWVEYIYREHGIMSVINPLMGRYGATIGGRWVPFTDYSDELTRQTLKTDVLNIVEQYKNTPGVLMFALGNESNYGLSWSSFEIETLPEGEQNTAKARYLYSLYEEVISAARRIAPNHLFTIVNGDIQYIDLIAELVPSLDILGSNVYRGPSFTSLWADVDEKLDLPVVFFEFGSDAFNAREYREDQEAQAIILRDQWLEMYNKSAGNGEEGNAIGGFVFEWRDEWWKYLQEENLDTQDNNASWSNQAYQFDWAEGQNNMNEEWVGIAALGPANSDGVYTARPRMAVDVLTEVWALDPYQNKKAAFNQAINNINMDYLALKGEVRLLKMDNEEDKKKLSFSGGSLRGEFAWRGFEQDITRDGENGVEFSDGQMIFLDMEFHPTENLSGQMSLNVQANAARKRPLEFTYQDRGLPLQIDNATTEIEGFDVEPVIIDGEPVEIYDFNAKYEGENFDVEAFYHTPRFHWGYEGDFFGLVWEATDIYGMDIWNAKAPQGVEFAGKGDWDNLKLVIGPEIYWGANPKGVFKYDFDLFGVEWTFIHSEDFSRQGEGTGFTQATERESRQTTLYASKEFADGWELEVGGIMAATEKVDEVFKYTDGEGNIYTDQVEFEDTLGLKAKLSFPLFGAQTYLSAHYAGLVADGGQYHKTFGVTDPSRLPYSGLGNKEEYEFGMLMNFGNVMVFPRFLYRENLVDANPFIEPGIGGGILNPGLAPRDRDNDPFAVLGNREARSAELFIAYDPTGDSHFWAWDNDWKENARVAFDFGGTYTEFPTFTDANLFYSEVARGNASFGQGLPAEDVWAISSRWVFNPRPGQKYITRFVRGFDQPTGQPEGGTRDFWEFHYKAYLGRHKIEGFYMQDAWAPYDFYRQFNITYPEQFKIDYSILLGGSTGGFVDAYSEDRATRVGIRGIYRSTDENSPGDEWLDGANDYLFLVVLYFTYEF